MSLQARQIAEREIARFKAKTELSLQILLLFAGIPQRTWREWQGRRGVETKHNNNTPKTHHLTPEEVSAIIAFCTENPLLGYRMQCWEMVDRNIAFVSCSSVYNIIKRYNLCKKWAEAEEMKKRGFNQPKAVHQQWHIDFPTLRYKAHFIIFLLSLMDTAGKY
jgi:hypothetical protein